MGDTAAKVTVQVTGLSGGDLMVEMPAWGLGFTPGIRQTQAPTDWKLEANHGKTALVVKPQPPGNRWMVSAGGPGAITLRYELPITGQSLPSGLGQRYPHTVTRAGDPTGKKPETIRYHESFVLRGGSTWLDVGVATNRVTFDLPTGFEVATVLPRAHDGSYTATDYPMLVAAPMHIGKFAVSSFAVDGVPHRVALSGFSRERIDATSFEANLTAIIRANQRAMGKLPYSSYVFLFGRQSGQAVATGHPQCAEIVTPQLRVTPALQRQLAQSHLTAWDGAYFHPVGWSRETIRGSLTEQAWFWLGAREYLTELAMVRAGFETPDTFWTHTVAAQINLLQLDARRLKTTVAETGSRIRTPDNLIQPGAPHPRLVGLLLCLLLDIEIRANTGGKASIEHVIRGLAAQSTSRKRGYAAADIEEWCEKVGGRKFTEILECVRTTKELPLTATLAKVGVEALPMTRPAPQARTSNRVPPRRTRPPRWQVTIPEDAPAAATKLRAGIVEGG